MKASARFGAVTDVSVIEFAKRIERKRMSIADNSLLASIAPSSSGQGWLRKLGLNKADIALSPEITLSKILKEWYAADDQLSMRSHLRGGESVKELTVKTKDLLNKYIGLIEYRVFGNNCGPNYPDFEDLASWLAWRTQLAHPDRDCSEAETGWKLELFAFAIDDAKLSFNSSFKLFSQDKYP